MEKYIINKTQKIVSALYLITDLIKDSEALKWEIREEGISFVSNAHLLGSTLPGEKDQTSSLLTLSSNKIISFLNIALVSNLISKMNATIMIHELESLRDFIHKNNQEIHLPGYILSDSFFKMDTPEFSKNQNFSKVPNELRTHGNSFINKDKIDVKDKKNSRQEAIIGLLKKDSNLTIKDFTRVITDCSEKTIQRELIELVQKGLVRKQGERRWSTYSLV